MFSLNSTLFTVNDLKIIAEPQGNWFAENSPQALAGRCLLDGIEYLRAHPKFPGRFSIVTNAHAARLATLCLSDRDVRATQTFSRLGVQVNEVCRKLLESRRDTPPFYGEDFWDWAAVLECFLAIRDADIAKSPLTIAFVERECESFFTEVEARLSSGLTAGGERDPNDWYGPATAAAAYRVLKRRYVPAGRTLTTVLDVLKEQSLESITNGLYRGVKVRDEHVAWHLGQVVAEFPSYAKRQAEELREHNKHTAHMPDRATEAYALARIIQGTTAIEDELNRRKALEQLYKCQNLARPLGEGIVAESVKGSLNALEGIWPGLNRDEKAQIGEMLAALNAALARSNTVGIIVALKCEADAVKTAFQECGARVGEPDADGKIEIQHSDFRAVMRQGKSNLDCCSATRDLLDKDEVRCVIMSGVAGSLGTDRICQTSSSNESNFVGPKLGDVIVAVSLAPWRIRDKVRNEIENAPVPLAGNVWKELPVDPLMFRLAHQAASEVFSEGSGVTVHEGLIVSGTGIKDDPAEKAMILNEWPSGKAVEEEGWVVAALCMLNNKPCIVVRSISDLAQGDKIRAQQISGSDNEENKQATAAEHAAKVAFRTAQLLSAYW